MSLLNRGTHQVTVFAEVTKTDSDGNTITHRTVGVLTCAVVQPLSSTEATTKAPRRSIAFGSSDTPVSSARGAPSNGKAVDTPSTESPRFTTDRTGTRRLRDGPSLTDHAQYCSHVPKAEMNRPMMAQRRSKV